MSQNVRAPELDAGLGWLNTDRPLSFAGELRGQVVVLDFWTYCCINCIHILPDLAWLEQKYRTNPVTFIGVHSAKFSNEALRENIRAAILRYEIQHPVVIDDNMKIWRAYAARSWPTLVIVDSQGCIMGVAAGEGNRALLDQGISEALEQGRSAGTLADGPLQTRKEASVRAASGLKFPGKVFADEDAGLLFVADSNHNRIVIAELPDETGHCQLIKVIGSGEVGQDDGPAEHATFNHPQGLVSGQGNLYVADTENHLIRAIDLESFDVTTVVGTGEMCKDRAGGAMGLQQGLNTPWDLAIEGATLYVAMAGTHQIWRIDLPVGFARAFAGSGRENLADGPTETSALAQPSGICITGGKIYFADSEVSAIRGIDMSSEQVFTVIGEGLFSFGDVDGTHPKAKFQHPLGIDAWGMSLAVADTYNHKIKLVDPGARSARSVYGTGQSGAATNEGKVEFFEPGGLSICGDHLFVADTNNHRIVRVHTQTHEWCEVIIEGLGVPGEDDEPDSNAIQADSVVVADGRDVELILDIELGSGVRLSAEAPRSVGVKCGDKTLAQQTGKSDAFPFRIVIPAASVRTGETWQVSASFACCTEQEGGLCVPIDLAWTLPVAAGGTDETVHLRAEVSSAIPV